MIPRPASTGALLLLLVAALAAAGCGDRPAAPPDRGALAEKHLAAGVARLNAGDPRGALSDLVLAAEYGSGAAEAHFALGVAYFEIDELLKARNAFETALEIDPRHAGALEYLGRIEYAENRLPQARARFAAALAIEPDRTGVKRRLEKLDREASVEEGFDERFTQHFRLKLENGGPGDLSVAERVGEILEGAYSVVGYKLGHYPSTPIPVILYGDREFYAVTKTRDWVGGLFDGKIRVPIKDIFKQDAVLLARMLTHEYVHACVYTLAPRCPTWLQEGLAQAFEGGREVPRADLVRAAREGRLASFSSLDAAFTTVADAERVRLLYAQSRAFVEYLIARRGPGEVAALLREIGAGRPIAAAVERVYGADLPALEADWRRTLAQ